MTSNISILPKDIIFCFCNFLEPKAISSLLSTCKRFKNIASETRFKKLICEKLGYSFVSDHEFFLKKRFSFKKSTLSFFNTLKEPSAWRMHPGYISAANTSSQHQLTIANIYPNPKGLHRIHNESCTLFQINCFQSVFLGEHHIFRLEHPPHESQWKLLETKTLTELNLEPYPHSMTLCVIPESFCAVILLQKQQSLVLFDFENFKIIDSVNLATLLAPHSFYYLSLGEARTIDLILHNRFSYQ